MPQFPNDPARLAAVAAGDKKWRGPACPIHEDAVRHTSSGQCVACNRESSAAQAKRKAGQRLPYVKLGERPERLEALSLGLPSYWGTVCPHGHVGNRRSKSLRYTRSTRCVVCAQRGGAAGITAAEMTVEMSTTALVSLARPAPRRLAVARDLGSRARSVLYVTARRLRALVPGGR